MEITPINQKRVYQHIIEKMVCLMKEGKLKTGDRLPPERALTQMLGVSRASLREALRAMEVIGLVDMRPGEGTFISELNIMPFLNTISPLFIHDGDLDKDLLEFRKAIELDAVRIVIDAGSPGAHALAPFLSAMRAALDSGDMDAGAEADIGFHKMLLRLTGNRMFQFASECVACLLESSVRFNRERILRHKGYLSVLLEQHTRIYEAILEKNADEAVSVLKKHLDLVKTLL